MVVYILEKGRVDGRKIGQVEGRVEIDRGAGQVGVARLDIDFGRVAQLGDKTPVDRPCLLVVNHLAVAEEAVAVETVAGVVGAGQHQTGAVADRHRDIGRCLVAIVLGRAQLDAAFEDVARLQRLDNDRAGSGVASVQRALRALQDLDLAQRTLILVELGGIGLENAVDDQRHRTFGVAGTIDAADIDLRVTRFRGPADNGDAGGQLDKFVGLLNPGAVEHLLGEDGDRRGHVGEQFVLAPRGDDDHVRIIACAGFLLARHLGQRGIESDQRGQSGGE